MYSVVLFNEKEFSKKYITLYNGEKKINKNSENFIVVNKTFFMMFMNFSK